MIDRLKKKVSVYAETNLPTMHGEFKVVVFRTAEDNKEHLAIIKGDLADGQNIPVRLHSECLTSEVLGSLKCDCREQLHAAFQYLSDRERGIILYLRQEGRGIGLGNKIRAYALQEQGYDTVEANHILGFSDDLRRYDIAAAMLHTLGVKSIRLLTNNPKKISGIEEWGIEVKERIPVVIEPNPVNQNYLHTKSKKSGHLIEIPEPYLNIELAS
jgi:GTP cyclohydrolase II